MTLPVIQTRIVPCPACQTCKRCMNQRVVTVCSECNGDPSATYYVIRRIALTRSYFMRHLTHSQAHDYVTKDRLMGWQTTMHEDKRDSVLHS